MLPNLLLIVVPMLVTSLAVPSSSNCSKGCNCSTTSVAVCNTLDFEPFGMHIFSLKIIDPTVPLILKAQAFRIRGLENVNSISIDNATILEIDKSAFTGIPLLSSFTIINSNISGISDSLALTTATNLRILSISNSTLGTFEFVKSLSLLELHLSGNKLTTLSKNAFANLPFVSYINLSKNYISKIDVLAFSNLLYLEELNLSNNNISSLDHNIFTTNTELVTLDLSNNPLKRFDINIIFDLEKLVLRSLKLETFSEQINANLSLLSYLDLSNNKMNLSTTTFNAMEDLEYVDLSNNGLSSLPTSIFKYNYKLQKVILDNNNFSVIPKLECHYDNFEIYYYSCQNCKIVSFPIDTFQQLSAIVILNLSHNHLNGINLTAIQHLPSLIELDLSYNNITVLNPLSFMKTTGLEKLNLAGNPITTLDVNLFYHNRALKIIDLSFCALQQLWKQPIKGKIPSLTQLNLANNSITSISPREFQVIPSLQVLDISNNPFICDQTLRDAITWLIEHEVSPASGFPKWKTHESTGTLKGGSSNIMSNNKLTSWKELAKDRCSGEHFFKIENKTAPITFVDDSAMLDEYDDNYEYFDNDEDVLKADNYNDFEKKIEDDEHFLQEDAKIDISQLAFESTRFKKENRSRYSFLWPTLVFILTALSVLVIAANIMLLMLRSKMISRNVTLPYIKIPQWNTNSKLKNHSGSVYQPLSEDLSGPSTPIIVRKERHVPTHSHTPKSAV